MATRGTGGTAVADMSKGTFDEFDSRLVGFDIRSALVSVNINPIPIRGKEYNI